MFGILRDFADGIRNMVFMIIERYDSYKRNGTVISHFSWNEKDQELSGVNKPCSLCTYVHPLDPPGILDCVRVAPLMYRNTHSYCSYARDERGRESKLV